MINTPPNPILPPSARPAGEVIASDASNFPIWKNVPGIYAAVSMGKGPRGDAYFLDANTELLANALDTRFPIGTSTSDSPKVPSADLQAVLDAVTDEACKLGWQTTWAIEGDVLTAHVPAAEADKIAETTFDLYKHLAKRLGVAALHNLSFDFDIAEE